MRLQPVLHYSATTVAAPSQVISGHSGVVDASTDRQADGFYHCDVRALSLLDITTSGRVDYLGVLQERADGFTSKAIVRGVGETTPDAVVELTRERSLRAGVLKESFVFTNTGTLAVTFGVKLELATDMARLDDVKAGRICPVVAFEDRVDSTGRHERRWMGEWIDVRAVSGWPFEGEHSLKLEPGERRELGVEVVAEATTPPLFPPPADRERYVPRVTSSDGALAPLLDRAIEDLQGLLLADPMAGGDAFLAAGAPWYLTLFGRDSLWAAILALPLGPDLAMGTLRTLARRQAVEFDAMSQAEPGKILHEVRATGQDLGGGVLLPPVYYGTIDATALWVILLHEAWEAGAEYEEVEGLVPALKAALGWIEAQAQETGFVRYVDSSGRGLANQGWKDSADGVRDADGSAPDGPISLCEVQGYCYQAMLAGAKVLHAVAGEDPGPRQAWASQLAERFRSAFWVDSPAGPYPAVALDGAGRPVTALTSNIGHLLGTGIVNSVEARAIAGHVMGDDLNSGFGLRTMAASTRSFNPMGYHTGSVWVHDTVIVARGLDREGMHDEAVILVEGVLRAAPHFGYHLPELYGGHAAEGGTRPIPYAAACHPQAWSAASAIEMARILGALGA